MRTIEATVIIGSDGKLIVQLPPGVQPGQHRVVVVIDDIVTPTKATPQPLTLQVSDWPNWPADEAFRREVLYDDHGR